MWKWFQRKQIFKREEVNLLKFKFMLASLKNILKREKGEEKKLDLWDEEFILHWSIQTNVLILVVSVQYIKKCLNIFFHKLSTEQNFKKLFTDIRLTYPHAGSSGGWARWVILSWSPGLMRSYTQAKLPSRLGL